jgi:hypothetical protein
LRGVAILTVMIHHAFMLPLLWVGVDMFFVLSGFLITGILIRRKEMGGSYFSYFYSRRVAPDIGSLHSAAHDLVAVIRCSLDEALVLVRILRHQCSACYSINWGTTAWAALVPGGRRTILSGMACRRIVRVATSIAANQYRLVLCGSSTEGLCYNPGFEAMAPHFI